MSQHLPGNPFASDYQATLALAYELRTQTLIEARDRLTVGKERGELDTIIRTRLGLNGDPK